MGRNELGRDRGGEFEAPLVLVVRHLDIEGIQKVGQFVSRLEEENPAGTV
jgi:hypothetical protein